MSNRTPLPFRIRSRIRAPFIGGSALVALTIGAAGVAPAAAAHAQGIDPLPDHPFELRPFAGAFLPTGAQHDLLRDAFLVGGQASYRVVPALAVTGTFAWSPNKDHLTRGTPLLDVVQYDVGLEGRAASWLQAAGWGLTPFAGVGLGGRTYSYRDIDVDPRSKVAGYGAAGGEIGFGRMGVRFEARDYMSRFTPLTGRGASDTRNDVTVSAGLTVRF